MAKLDQSSLVVCFLRDIVLQHVNIIYRVLELNMDIISGCMPTLKPLLRKTIGRANSDTPPVHSYEYDGRSNLKNSAQNRSIGIGDGLMDASYIELGPPGTNRDVHIAAEKPGTAEPWLGHGTGAIIKTDTFGQDVTYKDPNRSA